MEPATEAAKYIDEEALTTEKYWNELLQSLTSEDGLKIRKTEIDALLATDTVEFYEHLHFYRDIINARLKKVKAQGRQK